MKNKIGVLIVFAIFGISNINATTDNKTSKIETINYDYSVEKEEKLVIESWMIDDKFWKSESDKIDYEDSLKIEPWMFDENIWK